MLENNEEIQDLDLSRIFSIMVNELPWSSLQAYIQANSILLKQCTIGGHRLEPKRKKRILKLLMREGERNNYSQAFCNGIFVQWYPIHEEIHKNLEDYFHSDEYKEYRKKNDLDEDTYVLPEDKFTKFFKVEDLDAWQILLCFSPLQLNKEQTSKVIGNCATGNKQLLERIKKLEKENTKLSKTAKQITIDNEKLKENAAIAKTNSQEIRTQLKQLRVERDALLNKFEVSQAENKKQKKLLNDTEKEKHEYIDKINKKTKLQIKALQDDLTRIKKELSSWKYKYETQITANRDLQAEIKHIGKSRNKALSKVEQIDREKDELYSFADMLISRFDWTNVARQMKLTPTLKRQMNSLIKKLNYEEDKTLTLEGTLPEFWTALQKKEKALIQNIAKSNTQEMINGSAKKYWADLTDVFTDVKIGLEARLMLLGILEDIFYQTFEMEDLETASINITKKKK